MTNHNLQNWAVCPHYDAMDFDQQIRLSISPYMDRANHTKLKKYAFKSLQ